MLASGIEGLLHSIVKHIVSNNTIFITLSQILYTRTTGLKPEHGYETPEFGLNGPRLEIGQYQDAELDYLDPDWASVGPYSA